jgi:hypothetical protein
MKIKNLIITIAAFISTFYILGCNGFGIHGSGIIKDEERDIKSFEAIDVNGAYDVEIKIGEKPYLTITGDDNIIPLIKTVVKNNVLHIWSKKNISPRRKIKIEISTNELNNISSSGANRILATNINSHEFEVEVSGACSIKLVGKSVYLNVNLSGASNINSEHLKADRVKVDLSGASNATVFASEELSAGVSGVGTVNYYGNPKLISKRISGLGSINQKDF